ncbi:MAG: HisS family protein, partial [Saprospiraceae bacterium]|nr:HisS family protein [Saprospiraceae bacterium]
VVGSTSLMYEAEQVRIYDEVFARLGLPVTIRVNHRKVLAGLGQVCGIGDQLTAMTIAIDKLDKIGPEKVREEMLGRGISAASAQQVLTLLENSDLSALPELLAGSQTGLEGAEDLSGVFTLMEARPLTNRCVFDIRLARGLDYYTGCIFEVDLDLPEVQMGSLGGGGRYDDLTGMFGMPDLPGVGVSFGAARIYDVLEQLGKFPETLELAPRVLFIAFDHKTFQLAFEALTDVRAAGIRADQYPEPTKLKKQMRYADAIGVPYVALCGEEEANRGGFTLKDMQSGQQEFCTVPELIDRIR